MAILSLISGLVGANGLINGVLGYAAMEQNKPSADYWRECGLSLLAAAAIALLSISIVFHLYY